MAALKVTKGPPTPGPKHLPSQQYLGGAGKPLPLKQGAVGSGKPGKSPGLGNSIKDAPSGK